MDAIPSRELAEQLCVQIRDKNHGKWFSLAYWQCWGCMTFCKGDFDKMCLAGDQGCNVINAYFRKHLAG